MKRTIDMMIRDHRKGNLSRHRRGESSMSSLSGDWASINEEVSIGDQSNTSQSSRTMRIVAGMAILASSSPEIKALTLRRESLIFHSPSSSSLASAANLSTNSLYGEVDVEESKDDLGNDPRSTLAKQLSALSVENLSIEPPPSPRRTKLNDIAGIIDKENTCQGPRSQAFSEATIFNVGVGQRPRTTSFSSTWSTTHRDSVGSNGSHSMRPPKPSRLNTSGLHSPTRRTSMHRRVSFDSLPLPSEIGVSVPSLLYSSSSDRSFFSTPSTSSSSDRNRQSNNGSSLPPERRHQRGTRHRRGSGRLVAPRTLGYC
jgi:hypothetical protein